jgi:hypothetical protein
MNTLKLKNALYTTAYVKKVRQVKTYLETL